MERKSPVYMKKLKRELTADPRLYEPEHRKTLAELYGVNVSTINKLLTCLIEEYLADSPDAPLGKTAQRFGVGENKVLRIKRDLDLCPDKVRKIKAPYIDSESAALLKSVGWL